MDEKLVVSEAEDTSSVIIANTELDVGFIEDDKVSVIESTGIFVEILEELNSD